MIKFLIDLFCDCMAMPRPGERWDIDDPRWMR